MVRLVPAMEKEQKAKLQRALRIKANIGCDGKRRVCWKKNVTVGGKKNQKKNKNNKNQPNPCPPPHTRYVNHHKERYTGWEKLRENHNKKITNPRKKNS